MKNAIILHGMPDKVEYFDPKMPSASNFCWIPWLQKQLIINGITAATPEMPMAYEPDYPIWRREFERYDITPATILVGHSCGGGFIVRWLSENMNARVGKVVLVAPWLDPGHKETGSFFNFEIDAGLVESTEGLTTFYSDDDDDDIQQSIEMLKNKLPGASFKKFHGYHHFVDSKLTNGFPELLEEVLR
jgi:predicted alpha/beta hydrolase family esterase